MCYMCYRYTGCWVLRATAQHMRYLTEYICICSFFEYVYVYICVLFVCMTYDIQKKKYKCYVLGVMGLCFMLGSVCSCYIRYIRFIV
jgi:hypothetical protein